MEYRDYHNYKIYENGDIWSNTKKKILIPHINNKYYRISLWIDGKVKCMYIHTLLGLCFIPNPENKPEIDHIKSNEKLNNNLNNLRWATRSEQQHNKGISKRNKTGVIGVTPQNNRFLATFTINKKIFRKSFATLEDAVIQRREWESYHMKR